LIFEFSLFLPDFPTRVFLWISKFEQLFLESLQVLPYQTLWSPDWASSIFFSLLFYYNNSIFDASLGQ
jgi:hypothetical protein